MRKKIVQDVVSNKKSIQDISIPRRNKNYIDIKQKNTEADEIRPSKTTDSFIDARVHIQKDNTQNKKYNFEYDFDKPQKESKKGLIISLVVFFLALSFGISSLMSKATISVTAKKDSFPIKQNIEAIKNPTENQFGYQTISIENSTSKQITETLPEQKVEQKAYGTITVTNSSGKAQKLIANTRFESQSGLIYRIKDPITLPAGNTDVDIYADELGEKYNTAKNTKFTIPGFKNDPKYKTIYAVAKNDIGGGFVGTKKMLDENTKKTLNIELSAELKKILLSQINTQTPENFIYYPNTIKYNFKEISVIEKDGTVSVEKKGSVEVVIFDKKVLTNKLIEVIKEKNEVILPAQIGNLESLSVIFSSQSDTTVNMEISGDVLVKSTFDKALLKNDLLGLKKNLINEMLLAKYPAINESKVKIFPFWKSSLPIKPEKIIIKELEP